MSGSASEISKQAEARPPLLLALVVFPVGAALGCLGLLAIGGLLGADGSFAENMPFWLALGLAPLATLWVSAGRGLPAWASALLVVGTLLVTMIGLVGVVLLVVASSGPAAPIG